MKSPNVCQSVPYMVASHVGESGESGEYGDFGEFFSNSQMYVNQFHTWWPAVLANLANMAISANMAIWRILVKSLTVCKLLPYMVASHFGEAGEYGDFGEYGHFGEFL